MGILHGDVRVGETSPPQVVTIRNTGLATLEDFAGGAPFDTQFGAVQNCAGGVAPGASCEYTFTFSPTELGLVETTSNSSTNGGPIVIRLKGRGYTRLVFPVHDKHVTPLELDFGPVGIGETSAQQVVTIRNTGIETLTDCAGGAPFDRQFLAFQNCAGGVVSRESCQYTFSFRPSEVGEFETTSNSSTNAGPFEIRLRGTGVGAGLWVTPLELDFGPVPVGETSPSQVVTITNTGLATLESFAGGAPFDTQFRAFQNCAGGLPPGESCQYTFSFQPSEPGVVESTSNSSTNAGPFVIRLRGRGVR